MWFWEESERPAAKVGAEIFSGPQTKTSVKERFSLNKKKKERERILGSRGKDFFFREESVFPLGGRDIRSGY